MSLVQGRVKKHDGLSADYVSIFNWSDGKCIAQITPSASGAWEFEYFGDMECGITYVADGCEPITHGPYIFNATVPDDEILFYDFNGNTQDRSVQNNHGIESGVVSFAEGREEGVLAADFNKSGLVKTTSALPINGSQVSVCFWIKLRDPNATVIVELTEDNNVNDSFNITNGGLGGDALQLALAIPDMNGIGDPGYNTRYAPISYNEWLFVVMTADRSAPADSKVKVYINDTDKTTMLKNLDGSDRQNYDADLPFENAKLYIGARSGVQFPFDGQIQGLRVYNRILKDGERTLLFNE